MSVCCVVLCISQPDLCLLRPRQSISGLLGTELCLPSDTQIHYVEALTTSVTILVFGDIACVEVNKVK